MIAIMPDADTTVESKQRTLRLKGARSVLVATLGLNLLVALSKLIWGLLSNTLSMTADGFHSLLDGTSNIVGIVALTAAASPPDEDHPYGHRKFEAMASIGISSLMLLASFEILSKCFERMLAKSAALPDVSPASYAIMLVTMLVNIGVARYEHRKGVELNSQLLMADAKHTSSDVYATLGVLVSLLAIQAKFQIVDVIASLAIVCVVLHAGYGIIRNNLGSLVDAAVLDPTIVEKLVLSVPGVEGCHRIRSRGMLDAIFVDLHVQVSRHLSIEAAHEISFQVEDKLRREVSGVVDILVHIEDDNPPR